jgi:hypothetical protein
MDSWLTALAGAWAFLKDAATLGFLYRRDRREAGVDKSARSRLEQTETALWRLDVTPLSGPEWRLAQISRRQNPGSPRCRVERVRLIAPLGARLAFGNPNSPAAAFGQFHDAEPGAYGACLEFAADMFDTTDFETLRSPFPGAAYVRLQFFASPPRFVGELPCVLTLEIEAENMDATRRPIRFRLESDPLR